MPTDAVPRSGEPGPGWIPDTRVRRARHRSLRRSDERVSAPAAPERADTARPVDPADPADPVDPADPAGSAWAARLVRRGPWGALAERWVPDQLRGARVNPGRRGAALLSVIAALAAVVAAVGVWWSRPQPQPVAPTSLTPVIGSVAASGPSASDVRDAAVRSDPSESDRLDPAAARTAETADAGQPTPVPTGPILVSVTGKVRHPGVVAVPRDARVADAIAAAGGALHQSDLTGLNLAAHLSDGDSVVVAGPNGSAVQPQNPDASGGPGSVGAVGATPVAPVDLNTADQAALEQLPGVGPVTAAAIITWRTDHGPFTSVDQLQAVPGIGPAKFARISPHATV